MQMDPESFADGCAELAGLVSGHLSGGQAFLQEPVLPQMLLQPCKQDRRDKLHLSVCRVFFFFKPLRANKMV